MTTTLDVKQTRSLPEHAHDRPLVSCRFEPQGRFVFAGSEDRTVVRWSLADGAKASVAGHESWVKAIAFTKDGAQTITAGYDGRLVWWPTDAEKPEPIRSLDAHQGWVRSACTSPDGALLATGGNDHAVRLWNIQDGSLVRELAGHERHVYSVQFHPSGQWLLSGDLVGVVKQWDVATGQAVRTFDAKPLHTYEGGQQVDFGGVRSLAVSPDGTLVAAAGLHKATNPLGAVHEPLALLWEWETQKLLQSHIAEGITGGVLWRAVLLGDNTLMAASGGSSGGFLLFWKSDKDKEFHRFGLPVLARDMDVHPDGLRIATAHHDGKLRITCLSAA
ncbi:MAG: WD40 repeat domain-containing protein [Planctomycetota bacterium]|nr:MAG: WD40 repeat domain-containing protein [Planctomycetota bacterium]